MCCQPKEAYKVEVGGRWVPNWLIQNTYTTLITPRGAARQSRAQSTRVHIQQHAITCSTLSSLLAEVRQGEVRILALPDSQQPLHLQKIRLRHK